MKPKVEEDNKIYELSDFGDDASQVAIDLKDSKGEAQVFMLMINVDDMTQLRVKHRMKQRRLKTCTLEVK